MHTYIGTHTIALGVAPSSVAHPTPKLSGGRDGFPYPSRMLLFVRFVVCVSVDTKESRISRRRVRGVFRAAKYATYNVNTQNQGETTEKSPRKGKKRKGKAQTKSVQEGRNRKQEDAEEEGGGGVADNDDGTDRHTRRKGAKLNATQNRAEKRYVKKQRKTTVKQRKAISRWTVTRRCTRYHSDPANRKRRSVTAGEQRERA